MEEIKYTIYKLIDPISNEIRYVGLTFNDLKQRLKSHCSEKSSSHKSNWINRLKSIGLKPIIESIEQDISSYDEVCNREIYWIDKLKSDGHPLTNMASGGNKNKKMSDETRKLMSDSAKNRKIKTYLSESTKKNLSEKSKKRFEDDNEREKLRISNKRYEDSKTEEQKLNDILIQDCKSVYQYDIDMNLINIYPSINNASKINNLSHGNIAKCCKNKIRMVGGFVWRFEGDLTPVSFNKGGDKFTPIHQYDLDGNFIKEYENIKSASVDLNILTQGIRNVCTGKSKSSGGYIWKYKSDI
jgi:group I intron endonuclease